MKLLIIFLTLTQIAICQNSSNNKISITFIKPDSAKIDNSLKKYSELVVKEYQRRNDIVKKELTEFINSENEFQLLDSIEFEELKISAKSELKKIDSLDIESYNFIYFEYLSYYSKSILEIAVEQRGHLFEISETEVSKTKKIDLNKLAENKNYDFIIKFENLKTTKKNDSIFLTTNLILYSSEKNKIILEKEIEGNTGNNEKNFPCKNPLSCLFVNLSKNALEIYLPEIIKDL
ncbi:hypothetical protein MG296_14505 [Flavobacteriaceae bacterium TK19130]|nr:hypothetical protein [Thermobacterium salinum]